MIMIIITGMQAGRPGMHLAIHDEAASRPALVQTRPRVHVGVASTTVSQTRQNTIQNTRGLDGWLVPTREGSPGVGGLELGHSHGLGFTVGALV